MWASSGMCREADQMTRLAVLRILLPKPGRSWFPLDAVVVEGGLDAGRQDHRMPSS